MAKWRKLETKQSIAMLALALERSSSQRTHPMHFQDEVGVVQASEVASGLQAGLECPAWIFYLLSASLHLVER